jgi:hypothetical protein
MLEHRLPMEIRNQERNIISLPPSPFTQSAPRPDLSLTNHRHQKKTLTSTGFLLKITKFSARIVMNRVNFLHKILSISSACLIQMDIRILLIEGSTRTRSDSLREMINGLRSTSTDVLFSGPITLEVSCHKTREGQNGRDVPGFYFGYIVPFNHL